MEEKKLTYQDIPSEYPLCFNDECTRKAFCMHYQARLLLPEDRHHGPAVYPSAWQKGDCEYFREKKFVKRAWGFEHLYDNVPKSDKAKARLSIRSFFSVGCGPYYRYHNGESMLWPRQQDAIMKILAKYGSTDGIRFDHYVEDWNFEL